MRALNLLDLAFLAPKDGNLLLDTYPGALLAASFRKLRSAYTGPLVRLRRTSDNVEQDFYPGVDGWLDKAAVLSWAATAAVVTWYDQTGNGFDLYNATPAQQPLLANAGVILSRGTSEASTIQFGTGHGLHTDALPAWTYYGGTVIAAAARPSDVFVELSQNANSNQGWYINSGSNHAAFVKTSSGDHIVVDAIWWFVGVMNIAMLHLTASSMTLYNRSVEVGHINGSFGSDSIASQSLYIQRRGDGSFTPDGLWNEFLVYKPDTADFIAISDEVSATYPNVL